MPKVQDSFLGIRISRDSKLRLELLHKDTGEKPSKIARMLLDEFLADHRTCENVARKLGLIQ